MNNYFSKLKPSIYSVPRMLEEISPSEKLLRITKPWLFLKVFEGETPYSRVPEHYKYFYWSWKHGEKAPVHYIPEKGNFKLAENKESIVPVKNVPVQVIYPPQVDLGLWGGEGVIKGYKHLGRYKGETAKYWFPRLILCSVYSEILDSQYQLNATHRALELIDNHYGLDFYLFETPPADVNSKIAFRIKREMLFALHNQTLYPDDPVKKKEVTEKYKRFMVPLEEIEWYGLSLDEAYEKQVKMEEVENVPVALKYQFRAQLLEYLKNNPPPAAGEADAVPAVPDVADQLEEAKSEKSSSWIKKFNPFGK